MRASCQGLLKVFDGFLTEASAHWRIALAPADGSSAIILGWFYRQNGVSRMSPTTCVTHVVGLFTPTPFRGNTDNELSNPFCCGLTPRNGYVVQFQFVFGSNATAAILRASVSPAISARMPFCLNLSRNGLYGSCRLSPIAAETNTSFKAGYNWGSSSSSYRLSSSHHTAGRHFAEYTAQPSNKVARRSDIVRGR